MDERRSIALASKKIYSGTSGLVVPVPQAQYPPEHQGKSRLSFYATLCNSIEINSSFYKIPQAKTIHKWAENVPAHFKFTFKLFKGITHCKGLQFNPAEIDLFLQNIAGVGNKKGTLLIQLPPSVTAEKRDHIEDLLYHVIAANEDHGWPLAIEFRHPSWYAKDVFALLDKDGISTVIHDIPKSATPFIEPAATCRYLRFHGPGGTYRGSYEDDVLQLYAERINRWQAAGKDVFVYFNNTMGAALPNLQTLNDFIEQGLQP